MVGHREKLRLCCWYRSIFGWDHLFHRPWRFGDAALPQDHAQGMRHGGGLTRRVLPIKRTSSRGPSPFRAPIACSTEARRHTRQVVDKSDKTPRFDSKGFRSCPRMISSSSPAPVASSAAIWSRSCSSAATPRSAQSTCKPLDEWYQKTPGVENSGGRPRPARALPQGRQGRRDGLQPRRRHGRHGLHREQQGRVHAVGADQHAPADGRQGRRRRSASSTPPRPASTTATSRPTPNVTALQGSRRLPGACPRTATAGRSSSASACAGTSARTSASRPASPATTTSTARTAPGTAAARRRRPRSAARSSRPSSRASTRSRSGATASRPASSCTSTTASQGTQMLAESDIVEPLNLGSDELVTHQPAGRHRRGDRRHQAASAATTSTRPRACAAATATTR